MPAGNTSIRNRGDAYPSRMRTHLLLARQTTGRASTSNSGNAYQKQRGTQSTRNSEDAYKYMTDNQCSSEDRKKRRRWRRDMGWQTMCDERRSQTLRLLISERYRKS